MQFAIDRNAINACTVSRTQTFLYAKYCVVIMSFFVTSAPFDEPWDSDNEAPRELLQLTSDPYEGFSSRPDRDYLMEKAEDFLLADDPALFSDEFSGGEEWLDT